MTPALDKVAILLTVTRQLTQVLEAETDALRRLRLAELAELQAEKQALADVYETEFRMLRSEPEVLGAVSLDAREELEHSTRSFQEAARRNGLALQAAQTVVERALEVIGQSLTSSPSYQPHGLGPKAGEVVPFALDRTC